MTLFLFGLTLAKAKFEEKCILEISQLKSGLRELQVGSDPRYRQHKESKTERNLAGLPLMLRSSLLLPPPPPPHPLHTLCVRSANENGWGGNACMLACFILNHREA